MKKTLPLLFCIASMSSCVTPHFYYMPNAHHVPMLREKNEFHGSAAMGIGGFSTSTELQGAYSVSSQAGIAANYMSKKLGNISYRDGAKAQYFEGAAGYFQPLDKKGLFELYGGYGAGKQHDEYSDYDSRYLGRSDMKFNKLFIQPSIALTSPGFDIALSLRLAQLSFTEIKNRLDSLGSYNYYHDVDRVNRNRNLFMIEPGLTLRGGWKYVKIQLQLVYSRNTSITQMPFEPMNFNFGLSFSIAKRYEEKNAPDKPGN